MGRLNSRRGQTKRPARTRTKRIRSKAAHTVPQKDDDWSLRLDLALPSESMRAPGFVLGAGIVGVRATRRLKRAAQMLTVWSLMASCGDEGVLFDPHAPARGPSEHLPNTSPKALEFRGGEEPVPAPLETADGLPLSS